MKMKMHVTLTFFLKTSNSVSSRISGGVPNVSGSTGWVKNPEDGGAY